MTLAKVCSVCLQDCEYRDNNVVSCVKSNLQALPTEIVTDEQQAPPAEVMAKTQLTPELELKIISSWAEWLRVSRPEGYKKFMRGLKCQ